MKAIQKAITAAFCAMMAYVLLVIGLTFEQTAFNGKLQFLLPQAAMLAIGAAVWLAAEGACERLESRKKTERTWTRDALFWAVVFVVQAGVSYFVYFMPPFAENVSNGRSLGHFEI